MATCRGEDGKGAGLTQDEMAKRKEELKKVKMPRIIHGKIRLHRRFVCFNNEAARRRAARACMCTYLDCKGSW